MPAEYNYYLQCLKTGWQHAVVFYQCLRQASVFWKMQHYTNLLEGPAQTNCTLLEGKHSSNGWWIWQPVCLARLVFCVWECTELAALHTLLCHGLFQHLSSWRMTHQASTQRNSIHSPERRTATFMSNNWNGCADLSCVLCCIWNTCHISFQASQGRSLIVSHWRTSFFQVLILI